MPAQYVVYATLYSRTAQNSVRFIGFQKRVREYYSSADGGTIYRQGKPLDGAAKFAFPGGSFEGSDWACDAQLLAQRETLFKSQCGRRIGIAAQNDLILSDTYDEVVLTVTRIVRYPVNASREPNLAGYAACYLQVADNKLNLIADYMSLCFTERDDAVIKIRRGSFANYGDVGRLFTMPPADDELDTPLIYEIAPGDFANSALVQALGEDPDTDRFARIIRDLETIGL